MDVLGGEVTQLTIHNIGRYMVKLFLSLYILCIICEVFYLHFSKKSFTQGFAYDFPFS